MRIDENLSTDEQGETITIITRISANAANWHCLCLCHSMCESSVVAVNYQIKSISYSLDESGSFHSGKSEQNGLLLAETFFI